MLYAILCYKPSGDVESWSKAREDDVMAKLAAVEEKLTKAGRLGPVARLMPAAAAKTLKKSDPPMVIDGPFAETKEHLLGFFIVECATEHEAIETAKDLGRANPGGSFEIRPVGLFRPGTAGR
jgi:hypothetical protein